jgi:hypothetical protein
MARIRSIKPEFWQSSTLARLDPLIVLTFIGMLNHIDDKGRCKDRSALIKAVVHPLREEVTTADVEAHLEVLVGAGAVCRYAVDSERFLHLPYFLKGQRIDKPTESVLPPCPSHDPSVQTGDPPAGVQTRRVVEEPAAMSDGVVQERSANAPGVLPLERKGEEKEKEAGGEDLPPPLTPPPHLACVTSASSGQAVDDLVAVYTGIVPSPSSDRLAVLAEHAGALLSGGADLARLRQAVVELAGKDAPPWALGKFLEQVRMPTVVKPAVPVLAVKTEQQWKAGF